MAWILLYVGVASTDWYDDQLSASWIGLLAKATGGLLLGLGVEGVAVVGDLVATPQFQLQVVSACDGLREVAIFIAAVLLFPTRFRDKTPGILVGTVVVTGVNLIRLASLFVVGAELPEYFETAHLDIWPALSIAAVVLPFLFWLGWVQRGEQQGETPAPAR